MLLSRRRLHALTGAYALDALDDGAEQRRFTRHLRRCRACAEEVRAFREVATALAFAAAAEPPPELRERVMAAAGRTRQLPPEAVPGRFRVWLPRFPWNAWLPRLATVTAVAAVAAVVALGIALSGAEQQLSSVRTQSQAIAAVLAAPDVRTVTGPVTTGGVVTVVLSADRRELVVSTNGLAALPAGKAYELWLIGPSSQRASAVRRAGLLSPAEAGLTAPALASGLVAGDKLGMTVEPAGGTAQPTTTPILLLSLLPGRETEGADRWTPSTRRSAPNPASISSLRAAQRMGLIPKLLKIFHERARMPRPPRLIEEPCAHVRVSLPPAGTRSGAHRSVRPSRRVNVRTWPPSPGSSPRPRAHRAVRPRTHRVTGRTVRVAARGWERVRLRQAPRPVQAKGF